MILSRKTILVLAAVLLIAAGFFWKERHDLKRTWERAALPSASHYQPTTAPSPGALPAEVNLAVPFTVQAPNATWALPYKEFCEEASVLMAMSYIQGEAIATAEAAEEKMLAIKAFEDQRFGYYEDTTAAETATILREFYAYDNVELKENPTPTDLKQALASGKLIIVPVAGQHLGNPYFQQPGPLYHMFVIKGYTANGTFIVNDPGTRRGADFLYDEAVVMNAMHDWRSDGQVERGRKVILIVG